MRYPRTRDPSQSRVTVCVRHSGRAGNIGYRFRSEPGKVGSFRLGNLAQIRALDGGNAPSFPPSRCFSGSLPSSFSFASFPCWCFAGKRSKS
ncbi:unnamed protein product [Victoria cruziana]